MVIKCVSYLFVGGTAISFHNYLVRFGYDYSLMINYFRDVAEYLDTIPFPTELIDRTRIIHHGKESGPVFTTRYS
jgi:hypothetical protein